MLKLGVCGAVVGAAPLTPEETRPILGVFLLLFKSAIDFAAPATEPAIDKPAETEFIPTQGCPKVRGEIATALAFAIPVFEIILLIDATCSVTIPAIASALLSFPNAANMFCRLPIA